jgi:hypothetical protein
VIGSALPHLPVVQGRNEGQAYALWAQVRSSAEFCVTWKEGSLTVRRVQLFSRCVLSAKRSMIGMTTGSARKHT